MYEELIKEALEVRKNAHIPYYDFAVGACILCKNGKKYTGCNIENSAFGPSICAERVAIFDAIKSGERDFEAIAVVGGGMNDKTLDFCVPCGVCRQVMSEFCKKDFKIVLSRIDENKNIIETKVYTLEELLPLSFKL